MSQPSKPTWAFAAEGARLGITSCPTCGAAIVLNQFDDNLKIHEDWHRDLRDEMLANLTRKRNIVLDRLGE